MAKRALVLINGEPPSKELLSFLREQFDLFLCTDGAADTPLRFELEPDVVIGDLDSLSEEAAERYSNILVEKPSQYATDFEKALDYCEQQTVDSVVLVGLKGGRVDHAYTNFSILGKNASRLRISVIDEEGFGALLCGGSDEFLLSVSPGQIISLLPVPKAEGVITQGLKYPLSEDTLELGVREGQSNEADSGQVSVSIEKGALLVFSLYSVSWEKELPSLLSRV